MRSKIHRTQWTQPTDPGRWAVHRIPDRGDRIGRALAQVAQALFARGDDAVRRRVMMSASRGGGSDLNAGGRARMMTRRRAATRDAGSEWRFTGKQARVENDWRGDDRDDEQQSRGLRRRHSPIIAVRRRARME